MRTWPRGSPCWRGRCLAITPAMAGCERRRNSNASSASSVPPAAILRSPMRRNSHSRRTSGSPSPARNSGRNMSWWAPNRGCVMARQSAARATGWVVRFVSASAAGWVANFSVGPATLTGAKSGNPLLPALLTGMARDAGIKPEHPVQPPFVVRIGQSGKQRVAFIRNPTGQSQTFRCGAQLRVLAAIDGGPEVARKTTAVRFAPQETRVFVVSG